MAKKFKIDNLFIFIYNMKAVGAVFSIENAALLLRKTII